MIHPASPSLPQVANLLAVLEEQIELLEDRLQHLDSLTAAMVKVDNEQMEQLLARMDQFTQAQQDCHGRLTEARHEAAGVLGLASSARLSQMVSVLSGREQVALEAARRRLGELMSQLKRRHMETSLLLVECMRVNRMLLDQLLPRTQGVTMYGSQGHRHWRNHSGLVDAEL